MRMWSVRRYTVISDISMPVVLSYYRAINYDERDPFLCNSCGYSKYAKFETTVSGKSCAAVDPIENEEDRKKVLYRLVLWKS